MHQITCSSEGTDSGSLPGCPAEVGDSRCVFRMPFGVPIRLLRSVTGGPCSLGYPIPHAGGGRAAPAGLAPRQVHRPPRPPALRGPPPSSESPRFFSSQDSVGWKQRHYAGRPVTRLCIRLRYKSSAVRRARRDAPSCPPAASAGPGVSRACARARRASGRPTHSGTKAAAVATGTENWPGRKRQTRSDGRRLQL